MKIFKLSGEVTISIYTEVSDNSLEKAIDIAQNRSIERAERRNGEQLLTVWVSDEFDGSPDNIHEY